MKVITLTIAMVTSASAFVPQHIRSTFMVLANMPEELGEFCDTELWDMFPPGAHRDLKRFSLTGKEELSRDRIATMREILQFVDTEPGIKWEESTWNKGVTAWEIDNAEKIEVEAIKAKAEKKAKSKKAREAKEAAKEAANFQ